MEQKKPFVFRPVVLELYDPKKILDINLLSSFYRETPQAYRNFFHTAFRYPDGVQTEKMSHEQQIIHRSLCLAKEQMPYADLVEEAITLYFFHLLFEQELPNIRYSPARIGTYPVHLLQTNIFDDFFRGIDYMIYSRGKWLGIDLFLGRDVLRKQEKNNRSEIDPVDFFSTNPEKKKMKIPRKILHLPDIYRDFLYCFTNCYFARISLLEREKQLTNTLNSREDSPNGIFTQSSTDELIEEAITMFKEQYPKYNAKMTKEDIQKRFLETISPQSDTQIDAHQEQNRDSLRETLQHTAK